MIYHKNDFFWGNFTETIGEVCVEHKTTNVL